MKDLDKHKKIAVLIDADNAQREKLKFILEEISAHGHIVTKRAYGDWSTPHLKGWKDTLNELAIQSVQQFAYTAGLNATDILMIIDAMDLLYTQRYDAFALISSDSDFTALASRLRGSEVLVFGVGEAKTPIAFKNACDDFILTENLDQQAEANKGAAESADQQAEQKTPTRPGQQPDKPPPEPVNLFMVAWEKNQGDDGWVHLGQAGQYIKRIKPDFDPKSYGASKLSELIVKFSKHFQTQTLKGGGFFYRPKQGRQ